MKPIVPLFTLTFMVLSGLYSCRKPLVEGTSLSASGIVFDEVKNKPVANAKIYLFGANRFFTGLSYSVGPLDSVVSGSDGKFSINFKADGTSIDYGFQVGILQYGGYVYGDQNNYVVDRSDPMYKLNYARNVTNAVVKARELNYIRIQLKVDENPFDSFYVRIDSRVSEALIIGQTIDTSILLRHLPGGQTRIQFYTSSRRDTAGLAALNANLVTPRYSIQRTLVDTIYPDMRDTIFFSKTISNSLNMPR
jgi:hypothetical protein